MSNILQVPKVENSLLWDMAMRAESRSLAANTKFEALKKEFADMKRIDEGRCATFLYQESLLETLAAENGRLQRRLNMIKYERVVGVVSTLFCCFLTYVVGVVYFPLSRVFVGYYRNLVEYLLC